MPQWIKLAFTLTLELGLAWLIVATMEAIEQRGFGMEAVSRLARC